MTNPTGSILLRRGPTTDRLAFVPLTGEIIFDTTEKKVYVGDGLTAGGLKISSDLVLEDGTILNIPNSSLENSTISGVELGQNLRTLTFGTGLSGGTYNGGTAVTVSVTSTSTGGPNSLISTDANGNFSANIITATLNGNAATVTNGVYTNQSYANPSWITSLSETKVLPNQAGNAGKVLVTNGTTVSWQHYIPVPPAPNTLPVYGRWLNTNGTTLQWTDPYPTQSGNAGRFLQTNGATVGWASAGSIGFPSIIGNDGKYLRVVGPDIVWQDVVSAANGQLTLNVAGIGLSGSQTFTANQSTPATFTVTSNATPNSEPLTIVSRSDQNGFSVGFIDANLFRGDFKGSLFGQDSSLIIDAENSRVVSSLYGSVYSSNNSQLVLNTGLSTAVFTGDHIGDVYASNGTSKILENGTNGTDATFTGNVTGNVSGNAGTVTNGVVTTGSYLNPSWITGLALTQGGTGGNNRIDALTNLLPTGEAAGFVLKTSGRGTYFWSAETGASGTQGNTISTVRSTVTATAGQRVFTAPEYVVGAGQLRIYIDGVRQFPSAYTETSSTSFTLVSTAGVPVGTIVFIEVDAFVGQTITASTIVNAPAGNISSTNVQNAINELDQEKAPINAPSFTGVVTFGSYASIQTLLEKATITASAPAATTAFDVISQAVQYYTTNTANSFIVNIRGNSTTTLNSIMSVGQSVSLALLVTCNSTTHYATSIQIDGGTANVTTRWQGGIIPSSGNSSSIDVYTFTVIKTAATPAWTVLATQTRFG